MTTFHITIDSNADAKFFAELARSLKFVRTLEIDESVSSSEPGATYVNSKEALQKKIETAIWEADHGKVLTEKDFDNWVISLTDGK